MDLRYISHIFKTITDILQQLLFVSEIYNFILEVFLKVTQIIDCKVTVQFLMLHFHLLIAS